MTSYTFRLDPELKEQAFSVFRSYGLNTKNDFTTRGFDKNDSGSVRLSTEWNNDPCYGRCIKWKSGKRRSWERRGAD